MKKKKKNHKTYIKGKQLGTELSLKSQTKNSGNNQPDNVIYWEDKQRSLNPYVQISKVEEGLEVDLWV